MYEIIHLVLKLGFEISLAVTGFKVANSSK
jgi:hypothetical protein